MLWKWICELSAMCCVSVCTSDCRTWLLSCSDAAAVLTSVAVVDFAVFTADVAVVAVLTASLVTLRLTTPARPPFKNQLPVDPEPPAALPAAPERPPPKERPANPATAATPLVASIASASMEPPVWPTFTPKVAIKLSTFCDTFKNATAQRNQISTFPVTVSLLVALTCASTSASVMAKAGTVRNAVSISITEINDKTRIFRFVVIPPIKLKAGLR